MSQPEAALITHNQSLTTQPQHLMPVFSIQQAVERFNATVEFVRTIMKKDVDYGTVPGTNKPTLLKPGAEKLTTFFGLTKRFEVVEKVLDWSGADHDGEPFFFFNYRCGLYYGDRLIAEGDGSCNSRETKYRYRKAERECPACSQPAIIKGKEEFGGGWVCFKKKGGCGSKFGDNDESITSQIVGRIPNPDIADLVNTIQKMACKRSLIAATLLAVNASEFFTQDTEDMVIDAEIIEQPRATHQPEPQAERPAITKEKAAFNAQKPANGYQGVKDGGPTQFWSMRAHLDISHSKAQEIIAIHTRNGEIDWQAAITELEGQAAQRGAA